MTADRQLAAIGGALLVVLSVLVVPVAPAMGAAGNETSERLGTEDWPVEGHDLAHTGANPDGTGPIDTLGERWTAAVDGAGPVTGQPTVLDGTVYAGTQAGPSDPVVMAVRTDGTEEWNTTMQTTGDLFDQNPEVNASAAVTSDRVYVAGTDADGFVVALDRSDGSPVWDQYVGARADSSPIVVDGTVYVGSAQGSNGMLGETFGPLTALDASDGSKQWHVDLDGTAVVGSPAYVDGHIYVGTTGGSVYEVDPSNGSVVASQGLGSGVVTTPTVADGSVYVGTADGNVHQLSDSLSSRTKTSLDGVPLGTAVSGDSVYATTDTGTVYSLGTSDFGVETSVSLDGTPVDAPSVVDDTVYVATGTAVYTFGPGLEPRDDLVTTAGPTSGVVASNGTAFVGKTAGVTAVDQRCDSSVTGPDDGVGTVEFPGDCETLEAAVEAADEGETVSVAPGTYTGADNTSVTVTENLTVEGEGATLSGDAADTVANGLLLKNGTTLTGLTFTEFSQSAVWIPDASNVTVRDVTVDDMAAAADGNEPRGVTVEAGDGATGGGITVDGLVVDSSSTVVHGVLVRADGGSQQSAISGVTVRNVDVVNATTGVELAAAGGATVEDVRIDGATVSAEEYAVHASAGRDGTISGVDVTGVAIVGDSSATGIGVTSLAGSTSGTPATVEQVTVIDSSIRDTDAGLVLNATTAGGSDALVTGVAAGNLTVRNATGAGVDVFSRDASATSPSDAAVVRGVNVSDSELHASEEGLHVASDNGKHGVVYVEGSRLTDNTDGVLAASGTVGSNVTVTRSDVAGNADFGVENRGTGNLSATGNFWGDYSGPLDEFCDDGNCNTDGTGDNVSANVHYEPWVNGTTAIADADRSTAAIGETVEFQGDALTDDSTSVESWTWAFGDGSTATGQTVAHAFDAGGTYDVTLTVEDDSGGSDTDIVTVEVTDDERPVAHVQVPGVVQPGEDVTFDGSGSADNGEIAYYDWTFGDDTSTNTSDATTTHAYATEGDMTVTLTVGDTVGNENSTTTTVTVDGTAPNADLAANRTDVGVGDAVAFDASGSSDDEDEIATYEWDFDGDGAVDETTEVPTTEHTYGAAGDHDATVTAVDRAGNEGSATVTISVSDSTSPSASFTVTPSDPEVDQTVTFDASDSSDNGDIAYYEWEFGDGNTTNVSEDAITHAYDSAGEYAVVLTVGDSAGNEDSTTTTVTVNESTDGSDGDGGQTDEENQTDDESQTDDSTENEDDTEETGGEGGNTSPPPSGGGGGGAPPAPSPSISVTEASLSSNDVTVGEQVTVTATFENSGDEEGEETAELLVDGEATGASEDLVLGAGENETVTFTVSFENPGDYTVAVNDATVGTVGVRDPDNVDDRTESTIDAGTATPGGGTGVTTISFTAGGSGSISVTRLAELPDGVPAPNGTVLLPLRIQAPPELEDSSATVEFELQRSTVEDAGLAPGDVRLVRYHDGEWQQLNTTVVDRSDGVVTYAADTPGFSLFAAVGQQESDGETGTETETTTETATETETATASATEPGTDAATETETATDTEPPVVPGEAGGGLGPDVAGLIVAIALLLLVGGVGYRRFAREEGDVDPDVRV